MKKSIIMAVLVALVGQAQAVLMDVSRILHVSTAGGEGSEQYPGSSEGFGSFGPEAWRQEASTLNGTVLDGSSIGTAGGFFPGDGSSAQQGWTFTNSEAGMSWTGSLRMYGIARNLSEFSFTLLEPVTYTLSMEMGLSGNIVDFNRSASLGSSGLLDPGAYVFEYAESLKEGATNGVVSLRFASVPEKGTLAMLGIGLMTIIAIRRR